MKSVRVQVADITTLPVDAIVNAANEAMLGGGGVDGAIHRAAGPELLAACRELRQVRPGVRCPTGQARITPGFALPARHVIHTVGPVWHGGGEQEPELLASCYRSVLQLASERSVVSIAIPAISCGVYRFPQEWASAIAVRAVRMHLASVTTVADVTLVAFDARMADVMQDALDRPEPDTRR